MPCLLHSRLPAAVMETVAVKLFGVGLPKPKTLLEIFGAYIRQDSDAGAEQFSPFLCTSRTMNRVAAVSSDPWCVEQLVLLPMFVLFMIKHNPTSKVGIIERVIKELKEKHGVGARPALQFDLGVLVTPYNLSFATRLAHA